MEVCVNVVGPDGEKYYSVTQKHDDVDAMCRFLNAYAVDYKIEDLMELTNYVGHDTLEFYVSKTDVDGMGEVMQLVHETQERNNPVADFISAWGNGRPKYSPDLPDGDSHTEDLHKSLDEALFRLYGGDTIGFDGNNRRDCRHEWVEYNGLFDSFKYCKKCDKRRGGDDE